MIVPYNHWGYYCVEALVALLFAAGIWASRRSRFFWMAFSWFAFDRMGVAVRAVTIMLALWLWIYNGSLIVGYLT